jgi:hypothetical protein
VPFNEKQVPALKGDLKRVQTVLLDTITAFRAGTYATKEELLQAYGEVASMFEKTAGASLFEYTDALPDTEPSLQWRNDLATGLNRDLILLFFEMNQLGQLMSGLFNQQVSETDDLIGRIKRIRSKVGDYQLISGASGISIGESFLNTDNLDIGSDLISTEEAEVNTVEGAVTSKEQEIEVLSVESITIDSSNSNGVLGNNEETGVTEFHNDTAAIIDNNPDTWTEYENVVFQDAVTEALRLRVIMKLSQQSIVNKIEIDPVNFGQLSPVSIKDIRVSADGENWVSIVGDLPLAEYLGESEENTYVLSPESSRFSGKFAYTFLPRKVTHVSVDLEQDSGFLIDTDSGSKLRFVIGIKGIDIYSAKFASTSQLVSLPITTSGMITKLALLSAHRPLISDLASLGFSVSLDGGTTWSEIQPLTSDDMDAPEVLDIGNTTDNFMYKLTFSRNDEAFSELDSFDENCDDDLMTVFESAQINLKSSPATVTPSQQMANSDVVIMNAPVGSRANRRRPGLPRFEVGEGTGDALNIELPFELYPETSIKRSDIRVFVSGKRWTRVYDEAALAAADPGDRYYYINEDDELIFGDGDPVNSIGNGRSPRDGAKIKVALPAEELHFVATEGGYLATTDLASSGNRRSTRLERLGQLTNYVSEILPQGITRIELAHGYIDENNFRVTERDDAGNKVSASFKAEVDNRSELSTAGDYYVDYRRGIIYLNAVSSATATAVYKYYPHTVVDSYEWRADDENKYSGIFLSDSNIVVDSWEDTTGDARAEYGFDLSGGTNKILGLSGDVSSTYYRVMELSQMQVVAGSLTLEDGIFGTDITPVEVDYIDGFTELQRTTATTEEELAPITISGSAAYTIQLAGGENISLKNGVIFSNESIFDPSLEKSTAADVTTDTEGYHIDFSTGIVTVWLDADMPEGIIATYYVFSTSAETDGRYSVDYKEGLVFSFNKPQDGYKISYNYTKYRISYPVARALSSSEYTIDVERNTIKINTEALRNGDISIAYQFNPQTDASLSEVVEYYTPLVRDLRWRILTEGM